MSTLQLETNRLLLNQPTVKDIPQLLEIMKNPIYSKHTTNIPYPYTEDSGLFWIELAEQGLCDQKAYIFAIRFKDSPALIGGIGLGLDITNNKAELGYWLAEPFWNQGLITEAAHAIIQFGFDTLKLHKIFASYFSFNEASGRIMQKIGMQKEGELRAHTLKSETYIDHVFYGIINKNHD